LYKLEEKGYISVTERIVKKRLRRYYSLLDTGREYYAAALKEYEDVNNSVRKVLYYDWKSSDITET
jgi:DNA-binding PadR family transcriptional regulator